MTPKEKAKELANKFVTKSVFDMDNNELKEERKKAKQCALIAVDEVMKSMDDVMPHPPFQEYWGKVKQEIEKL